MTLSARVFVAILVLMLSCGSAAHVSAQDNEETYDEISAEMAEIRDLELLEPIDVEVKTREQLQQETREDLEEDYPQEEREDDQLVLVAFGLMDPDVDLGELYVDVLGEQIAGYYDPETDEMVVVASSDADELSASNQVTFAHEVVHALQDQHYDLERYDDLRLDGTGDESLAVTALIEGDATVSMIDFVLGDVRLARLFLEELESVELSTEALDSAPAIIAETLTFPYDQGQVFVQYLYDEGGWDMVDDAYADPPTTTEQILHPEKYLAGEEAVPVDTPDLETILGAEWRIIDEDTMGEFQISILLGEGGELSSRQVTTASEGWGGDAYAVASSDAGEAILWQSEWDSAEDAEQFAMALANREATRLDAEADQDGDAYTISANDVEAYVEVDGSSVTYGLAPDRATLDVMLAGAE